MRPMLLLLFAPAWAYLRTTPSTRRGFAEHRRLSQLIMRGSPRDSVERKRARAVPFLDTEKWLKEVESNAEATELDTAYWLESVDASATTKSDADAETTRLLTLSAGASTTSTMLCADRR